jgi:hypothetical protein
MLPHRNSGCGPHLCWVTRLAPRFVVSIFYYRRTLVYRGILCAILTVDFFRKAISDLAFNQLEADMERFYFHQKHSAGRIHDLEGAEFSDLDAAKAEAILSARQIICNLVIQGQAIDQWFFEIANEAGTIVFQMPFADAIPVSRR